jgi:hypothetical protein
LNGNIIEVNGGFYMGTSSSLNYLGTISVFGFSTEMNQLNSDGSAKVFGGK